MDAFKWPSLGSEDADVGAAEYRKLYKAVRVDVDMED